MSFSSRLSLGIVSDFIFYTTPRDLDFIPQDCQGVYAWYAPPPTKIEPPIDEKTYHHYASIFSASGRELVSGRRYKAEVHRKPVPKQSYFVKSVSNQEAIEISVLASLFSSPLYVGKACGREGIKGRLKQEEASADFRSKFLGLAVGNKAMMSFNFNRCLIKYVDVGSFLKSQLGGGEEVSSAKIEDACNFLEQAIFWAGFPALNTKMGV